MLTRGLAWRQSPPSPYHILYQSLHTPRRRRLKKDQPPKEPKSDRERRELGLPEREPWFEVLPFQEKKKTFVHNLKELLKRQDEQVMRTDQIGRRQEELEIARKGKSRKMSGLIRKYPSVFELYQDEENHKRWCGFTDKALDLLEEERQVTLAHEDELVTKLRKLLMLTVRKRLPLDRIVRQREYFGLPHDFRESLLPKYPQYFVIHEKKGRKYLELTSLDASLAVTAVEREHQRRENSAVEAWEGKMRLLLPEAQKEGAVDDLYVENSTTDTEQKDQPEKAKLRIEGHTLNKTQSQKVKAIDIHSKQQKTLASEGELDSRHSRAVFRDAGQQLSLSNEAESYGCQLGALTRNGQQQCALFDGEGQEDAVCDGRHLQQQTTLSLAERDRQEESHGTEERVLPRGKTLERSAEQMATMPSENGLLQNRTPKVDNPAAVSESHPQHNNDDKAYKTHLSVELQQMSSNMEGKLQQQQTPTSNVDSNPCLRFYWKPKKMGALPKRDRAEAIERFQSAPYISPYKNCRELQLPEGSLEEQKFIVSMIHEFLSLTIEKRSTVENVARFTKELRLPVDLLGFLRWFNGIFYIIIGEKKNLLFLKEAYEEGKLIEKDPFVLCKERFLDFAFGNPTSQASELTESGENFEREL